MLNRSLFTVLILIAFEIIVTGQKMPLTHLTPEQWPMIESSSISSNGKFVKYTVRVPDSGTKSFVQTGDSSWKKEFSGIINSDFTNDSRKLIFRNQGDSMGILELGTDSIRYIEHVVEYEVPEEGAERYIAYRTKGSENDLTILNVTTGNKEKYEDVGEYIFNKCGSVLAMEVLHSTIENSHGEHVFWLGLGKDSVITICHGCQASQLAFDQGGTKLICLTEAKLDGHDWSSIKYYAKGMDSAITIVDPASRGMNGMKISPHQIIFSKDGMRIFFWIEHLNPMIAEKKSILKTNANETILGIHDTELKFILETGSFLSTVDLNDLKGGVVRLQQEADKGGNTYGVENGDWLVTESHCLGSRHDATWNISARPDIYLISKRDGSRRLLKKKLWYNQMYFSPSGKYIIWFDQAHREWFSYNTRLNNAKVISAEINQPVYRESDYPDYPYAFEMAGWIENDKGVLIYDRWDIWQVDLDGITKPVNITHSYGARNNIRFRYVNFQEDRLSPISGQDTLLLSAFNMRTKQDGFYRLVMSNGHLEKLIMSDRMYTFQVGNFCGDYNPGLVMKARYADNYLLSWMSATEYPNLYTTDDFRDFRPISTLEPQKQYNWYTTDLIHWKLPDGKTAEGILFKPENFDAKKKYPIIFYYYEKNAFDLNIFIHPALSDGVMNIPWFVSNGYLVFVPDIYYRIGHPGQSACDAVTSAAEHLSKRPWVDSRKMGLQGHSFGGFETNYIVTHSTLFTAAAPASGVSNVVESYGEEPFFWELGQGRIHATPWKRPDLYLENSPILNVDRVTASILIMHTKNDVVVPYSQGLQWYNALRRLDKKAWLLAYKDESHILDSQNDRLDYSIRLGQFFDHYLKNAPAPVWMTRGLLPSMKAYDDGLELDTSGKEP